MLGDLDDVVDNQSIARRVNVAHSACYDLLERLFCRRPSEFAII